MSRPDGIPQDVWDAARAALGRMLQYGAPEAAGNIGERVREGEFDWSPLMPTLVDAILAERERCAKVADQFVWDDHALAQATDIGRAVHHQSVEIASAIRKGGE